MTNLKKKNLFGLGIVLSVLAALISLMCIAFSYADINDSNDESDVAIAEQEAANADPVVSFEGLPDDYVIRIQEKDIEKTTTEKTFPLTGIKSNNYIIDGFVSGGTRGTIHVTYDDSSGQRPFSLYFDSKPGYLMSMVGVSEYPQEVPSTQNTTVKFDFKKVDNPKYYIKVIGLDGASPLEGVDFWYMSNDGTIFPTVTTSKNESGTEASAKYEVSADKINGYYNVCYNKFEPEIVYEDDIDILEYSDFEWDEVNKEFIYVHEFNIKTKDKSTLLLTSDGNLKYFQMVMSNNGKTITYCSPRISQNLGGGAPIKMSATCNIFDGGDVTCIVDNEYVHMNIPVKIFAKDGYVFDRWECDGVAYRAGSQIVIDDVRELTTAKIYFTNGPTEIAQTGDAIPFVALVGLGMVAVVAFVVSRKQFN